MIFVLLSLIALAAADTATWYDFPGGGDSCRQHGYVSQNYWFDGGFCGAPSEDIFPSLGESGKCGQVWCSNSGDNCNRCCYNVAGPSCPYSNICRPESGQQAKFMCVRCAEPGRCKHTDWIRIGIADACPSVHPCNVCKGVNPCAAGRRNVDLCWGAWDNIFTSQVSDSLNGGGNKLETSTNWRTVCPKPGRNYGGGGGGGGCSDIAPPGSTYTCAQQKSWGKCGEAWMQGYCKVTCGTCASGIEDEVLAIAQDGVVATSTTSAATEMNPTNIGLIVACSILLVAIVIVAVLLVKAW